MDLRIFALYNHLFATMSNGMLRYYLIIYIFADEEEKLNLYEWNRIIVNCL